MEESLVKRGCQSWVGGKEKGDRQMGFPIAPLGHYQTLRLGLRGSVGRGSGGGTCRSPASPPSLEPPSPSPSPVPAMITSHPNTTIAIKGHAKELNCTARGERPIIIRWEKGDTVIDPDRVMRYAITTKDSGDEVVSTLKVSTHARLRDPDSQEVGIPRLYPMEVNRKFGESLPSSPKLPPFS